MFHPLDHPLERGWVGRIDGDSVTQLAAQTLQSLLTGGGSAREHAVYPLAGVRFLAPVLHPPAVRIFEDQTTFAFANPAAVVGPGATVGHGDSLTLVPRLAAVIGLDGAVAGFTAFAEWRMPEAQAPKDRDFAFGLGPVVVTPNEVEFDGLAAVARVDGSERWSCVFGEFDWTSARDLAAEGTRLTAGDLLAGPPPGYVHGISPGSVAELEIEGIGVLHHGVAGA